MFYSIIPHYFNLTAVQEIKGATFLFPLGAGEEMLSYVFYQPNPDVEKGHTHLFALTSSMEGDVFIRKGDPFFDCFYSAASDGKDVYISNYRHALINTPWGFIDGGSEYTRTSIVNPPPNVKVGMLKLDWKKMLSFIQDNDKKDDFETRYDGLSIDGWEWK